jgi:hypothetical protein
VAYVGGAWSLAGLLLLIVAASCLESDYQPLT